MKQIAYKIRIEYATPIDEWTDDHHGGEADGILDSAVLDNLVTFHLGDTDAAGREHLVIVTAEPNCRTVQELLAAGATIEPAPAGLYLDIYGYGCIVHSDGCVQEFQIPATCDRRSDVPPLLFVAQ